MKISTKGRYALRVMSALATDDSGDYVPLKDIAKKQEISEKYLEAIIKSLVKAKFVVGVRGKGGGYRLACPPTKITVKDILEATEGSLAPVACLETGCSTCPRANECVTLPMWQGLHSMIQDYLSSITLEQMIQQAVDRGVPLEMI